MLQRGLQRGLRQHGVDGLQRAVAEHGLVGAVLRLREARLQHGREDEAESEHVAQLVHLRQALALHLAPHRVGVLDAATHLDPTHVLAHHRVRCERGLECGLRGEKVSGGSGLGLGLGLGSEGWGQDLGVGLVLVWGGVSLGSRVC